MDRLEIPVDHELAIVLTDDAQLHTLNLQYRGIDQPTDVLSFPADPADLPPGEPAYLGDILISVPYAARNAEAAGWSLAEELRLLAVHGLLHLLGHDDETDAGADAMHAMEVELGVRPADDANV